MLLRLCVTKSSLVNGTCLVVQKLHVNSIKPQVVNGAGSYNAICSEKETVSHLTGIGNNHK